MLRPRRPRHNEGDNVLRSPNPIYLSSLLDHQTPTTRLRPKSFSLGQYRIGIEASSLRLVITSCLGPEIRTGSTEGLEGTRAEWDDSRASRSALQANEFVVTDIRLFLSEIGAAASVAR